MAGIIVAYEPVWAIGTGHVCEPKKASDVIKKIRNLIGVIYGAKAKDAVRIIYGGSINEKNVAGFVKQTEVDGFLVGGSSLDHKTFASIVATVDGGKPTIRKTTRPTSTKKAKKAVKRSK